MQIPVKNIKYDATYKVTFDFSVARQGNKEVANITMNNTDYNTLFEGVNNNTNSKTLGKNLYDYAAFEEIFPSITANTQFRSYLYSSSDLLSYSSGVGISNENHKTNRNQIVYSDKVWNNRTLPTGNESDFSLTCYNPVTRFNLAQHNGFLKYPNYTTVNESGTVNDPFCTVVQDTTVTGSNNETLNMDATTGRNWFNAVQHVEQNGQQGINWITFYNTTFSFNIGEEANKERLGDADEYGFIQNLYWVWQIDALEHMGWYNIRIDNVRIQEVVKYSSEIYENGVEIAGTKIGTDHIKYYGQDLEKFQGGKGDPRGWNGTGQNCIPRGFDENNFFSAGNIYAPVIDARKFSVAPGEGEGADDYKIKLSGWAVCDGGISKYVYSADGGKTWHDMTFTGTNVLADKTVKDNKTNNRNITVSGWTYAEYGVEQKLNQQTIYNDANSNFVTFDASDGANCNFEGLALCADLTPYKNQPDLDIIIAAVPATNTNLRCEILRIMNYHSSNFYASQIESISSDIVSSNGNIEILQKDLAITSATNGNGEAGNWFTEGTKFYYNENNWHVDYYPTSGRGVITHLNAISSPIRYDNIEAMASDIPIKKILTIKGFVVCYYGVYDYAYSVDGGKTWIDFEQKAAAYVKDTDYTDKTDSTAMDEIRNGTAKKYELHQFRWLTRGFSNDGNYFASNNYGKFDTTNTALKIDLSAYEGQVVDVIVAAKPYRMGNRNEKNDIYLPIAKIDNVGVYGDNGTFYSRIHRVMIDGRTNENLNGDINATPVAWDSEYPPLGDKKEYFNFADKWNIGYNSEAAYTIFEPQNVNAINSRYINNELNKIKSGGRVTIDGYVMCKGGVSRYKFSLDGGKTWTVINDTGEDITSGSMETYSKYSDKDFTYAKDGENGNFCCTSYSSGKMEETYGSGTAATRKKFYDHALEFSIPALPDGAIRDLLVVAESTQGKLIPVLHMKIQCENVEGNSMQYGYYRSTQKNSSLGMGWFNTDKEWSFYAGAQTDENGNNYLFNRMTIPVTKEGEQQLTFTHRLFNEPNSVTTPKHLLYNDDKTPNKQSTTHRSAKITLTTTKTHYLEGEKIGFNFGIQYTNTSWSGGFGTVTAAIISEDWLNQNGRQHTLYSQQFAPDISGTAAKTITIDDIKVAAGGAIKTDENPTGVYSNGGLSKWALDLKAGKYSIVLIHRDPFYYEDGNTSKPVAYGLANILYDEDLRSKYLLAQVPIYIHSADETVDFSVIHDEGEYTYFSDLSRQFTAEDRANNENIEHIYTLTDPFSNDDTRGITATVNVTKEDVKRGYIVLDVDYTKLMVKNNHTKAECEAKYPLGNNKNNASHSDNLCVSRQKDNNSVFTKKVKGDVMYDFSKDIVHAGMYYHTYIDFGTNPLIPTEHLTALNVPFTSSKLSYGSGIFMNTVSSSGNYELNVNPILNPSIKKGPMYNKSTDFKDAYISVPKTYFLEGEPITVNYSAKGLTGSGYIYITSDQECQPGRYGDLYIKRATVDKDSSGTVNFTGDKYNLSDTGGTYDSANVPWQNKMDKLNELRNLPTGEYKVYFINASLSFDVYNIQRYDSNLVTEPITIKVIDPESPDLSISLSADIPYGSNNGIPTNTGITTEIILDRVVYEKGEDIHFKINGSWVRNWVTIMKYNEFSGDTSDNRNGTWFRYAQWGTYHELIENVSADNPAKNFVKTSQLEPGQYKLVYLFGQNVTNAWEHKTFTARNNSLSKIIAIIDITILPEGSLQQHTATYTNANGEHEIINLGTNTFAQSIQAPIYSVVEVSNEEIATIRQKAGYADNTSDSANYGTSASLKYKFGSYAVKPTEYSYTLDIPSEIVIGPNNLAYNCKLTNNNNTVSSAYSFNLLCPNYSFTKKQG